ncbi:MAG: 30S ribosomal protein THX, partial [Bacteroidales bacterium]|nr:30S ribosomal protein THX [Bacteroidales bacterium]
MGKGDKKTKRGKINSGSYGNKRPRKKVKDIVIPAKKAKKPTKKEELVKEEAPKKVEA